MNENSNEMEIIDNLDIIDDENEKSPKKKNLKLFFSFFLLAITLFISALFIWVGLSQRTEKSIIFTENGDVDYKVYLKENNYYTSPYLEKGMSYVASLIDYIRLDFNYNVNSSDDADLEFKYDVNAELIITERGEESKVLFKKPIVLKENITKSADSSGVLNEQIDIRYDDYNAMVNSYKKEYALSVSSKLVVTMHVESVGNPKNLEKNNFMSNSDLTVSIPLSEQTISVLINCNTINNSKQIVEYGDLDVKNYIYLTIGGVFGLISLFLLVKTFYNFTGRSLKDTEYEKTKKTIIREFDRVIVETNEIVDTRKYESVVYVKSFNELLDVRDNVEKPILFHENVKRKISCFMVIDNNILYIYKIRESDMG